MIGYYVPHKVFPDGYHCDPKQPLPFLGIASQKKHMAVYLCCIYTDPDGMKQFVQDWKKTGKKLDMGKSCLRFKKLEDVALDVLGDTIGRIPVKKFVANYLAGRDAGARGTTKKKRVAKKAAKKKTSSKKATRKVSRGRN